MHDSRKTEMRTQKDRKERLKENKQSLSHFCMFIFHDDSFEIDTFVTIKPSINQIVQSGRL